MIHFVLEQQKEKRNILFLILCSLFLLSLYTLLDNYGFQSYIILGDAFGFSVVWQTITLNILISVLSAFTISLTLINYRLNNSMTSGSFFASIGNLVAVIFTGCASCGISVLGALGVGLVLPVVTPGAVQFKFFALLVVMLGLIIVIYIINTATCSIKKGGSK